MAKHVEKIKSVPSHPAKNFFVSMLTRDIDLQDAILDLLDNCVDGAIRTRSPQKTQDDSLKGFQAEIEFDDHKFVIEDNCGGIPWTIARDYAFLMGRPEGIHNKPGMIGVVGIGMKRAIFKMGRECFVHSNHKADSFLVTISPSWFEDDKSWNAFEAEREAPATSRHGTIIEITHLTEDTKKDFKRGSSFRENLPEVVAEAYTYLIEKGFEVKINGKNVSRKPVKLCFEDLDKPRRSGDLIRPYVYEGKVEGVEVFLAVGYRSRLRTQEEQDDEKEATFAAKEAGWTIVCNDRVVLSSDRTIKTGWGFGGVPNFHNQFSCIAGVVEFRSPDMAKLPITTTKRGVDTSKDMYTLVRQRMQEGLRHFTRNTNKWKGFESELKQRFDRTKTVSLEELKRVSKKLQLHPLSGNGIQRQYKPQLPERRTAQTTIRRICFTKELAEIEKVSRYVFDEIRSPDEVGEVCFDRILKEAKR